MALLETIGGPDDLKRLDPTQLEPLALEIRNFLVTSVARTGGHLGPNLGAVELTVALHRAFDSPRDRILWDTGHQAYVHKILTGRQSGFSTLRQQGGLSGYPNRSESDHDVIENCHASTALSYADGLAKAFQLQGLRDDRHVVAVVGDGSLTGGMAWEALNNIAAAKDRPLIIVVNDNERSYSPTIGGLANHLATLRTTRGYERFLEWGKQVLGRTPVVGQPLYDTLHGVKKGLKDIVAPQGMFEDLGLKYVGPVDGHDVAAIETALRQAKQLRRAGPRALHYPQGPRVRAGRGRRSRPLPRRSASSTRRRVEPMASRRRDWTSVFSDEMVAIGCRAARHRRRSPPPCCIPSGSTPFARRFPDRVFDVGIAEQHAVTSAAGSRPRRAASGGGDLRDVPQSRLRPGADGCRAASCRCDVRAGPRRGDRAGRSRATTACGTCRSSSSFPGCGSPLLATPASLVQELREAIKVEDAPTVVRFPRGPVGEDIPAVANDGGCDILRRSGDEDVLLVSIGPLAGVCLEVADRLVDQGLGVTVVDPRWVKPVPPALASMAGRHRLVVTIEDNGRVGGAGAAIAQIWPTRTSPPRYVWRVFRLGSTTTAHARRCWPRPGWPRRTSPARW